jgi:riboflavin kinase/FMN adenylyltransferase
VVTIGVFDGVHRGHLALLGRARRAAHADGLRSVAITFDRHPSEVVRPGSQPKYLQPLERKVTALLDTGVDLVYVLTFDQSFSRQSPEQFIEHTLTDPLDARRVVVGSNFRFGHRARGDVAMLDEVGARHGFTAEALALLDLDGVAISSTQIREHLARGEVGWAGRALGRPYEVEGAVVKGDGRGRSIGFATANVEVDHRLQIPAAGVYAGHAGVVGEDARWPMVANVGHRPTFGGDALTLEVHLLDVDRDLYGDHLAVAFGHRLRDEQRFDGVDALVAQIDRDVARARRLLATGAHG